MDSSVGQIANEMKADFIDLVSSYVDLADYEISKRSKSAVSLVLRLMAVLTVLFPTSFVVLFFLARAIRDQMVISWSFSSVGADLTTACVFAGMAILISIVLISTRERHFASCVNYLLTDKNKKETRH